MPSNPVLPTAEGMPRFDKAQIMRDAWSIYRKRWSGGRPANEQARRRQFAMALKNAWAWAKEAKVEARKTLAEKAADRARELTNELMRLDARPWGMRSHLVAADRAAIAAEINTLTTTRI